MNRPLQNVKVAITEHRFTQEFTTLFQKLGAEVYACPLLAEAPVENRAELQAFIRSVISEKFDEIIFLTGVGARMLIAEAESIGRKQDFIEALDRLTVIARGSKPVAALRQFGVRVDITPAKPTTEGVIGTLAARDLRGRRIGVQLYGTPNPQLMSALARQGASAVAVQVYGYTEASGREAVHQLIFKTVSGAFDVITFTSAPQVRMLFDAAGQLGLTYALLKSLNNGTAVASVGEVTSRELESRGVMPKIIPDEPKMGPLVLAVASFFERRDA